MRLGVLSDTHGKLLPQVFDLFSEVDHILHAGDVGSPNLLVELEAVAPVSAVFGNTDGFEIRGRCPQVARLELDGFIVVVTHGDQFGTPTPQVLHQTFPDAEIIVFGHTHKPLLQLVDKTVTVMNPGSVGVPPHNAPPTVGILELEAGIPPRGRIVELQRSQDE